MFDELTSLKTLRLEDNALATLPDGAFNGLTALTTLYLDNNDLDTLPSDVFDDLTLLTDLYLYSNDIDTLPNGVFEKLTALTDLRLSLNPVAPVAPTADARPDDGTVPAAGGTVMLDGSNSDGGPWGTNVTYAWALTTPTSGATFDNDKSATPEVTIQTLPDGTELTFTLTVTGRGHKDTTFGTDTDTDTATVTATTITTTTPGITVSPTSLPVNEGSTGTYTVLLDTQPTATVTVTINDPTDNTDVTADPASLSFSTSNWSTLQTVTVRAAEDADSAQDTGTVTHTVSGGDYGSVTAADVAVTVTDNDTAGVTVSPTTLPVNEGSTGTYTVLLDTQPTATVTVTINDPTDNTDVTADPASLSFSTSNWSTLQTVTVRAAEDADSAQDTGTVTHTVSGGDYGSVTAADVAVTVTDNDTAGVTVSPTTLPVNEGSTGTYTVLLDTQPTATVTVTINDPTDNTDVTADPASLSFSTSNWSTLQTVTVRAAEDADSAQDTGTVTHTVSGGDYGSVTAADVAVTVTDNDTAGVTVSPTTLPVNEGSTGTYTVLLDTQPTATVTVTINDPTDNTDVTADPASLSFSTSNWSTLQTVTVRAAEDADSAQDTGTVTHTVSGGDYGSVTAADVAVTVTDNDTAGVTVSPTTLPVNEGSTGTYTVLLDTQPTATVTVTINDPTDNTDVTADPASLSFSTSNWSTLQTVTVRAAEDADSAQDTGTVTHTVSAVGTTAPSPQPTSPLR